MPQRPENRMLNRLKPKLERDLNVYIEKTHNAYRGGTPDWYIEWENGCGWIEAKFWDIKTDNKLSVPSEKILEMCTKLQQGWLHRARIHSVPAGVLCGFPDPKKYAFIPYPLIGWEEEAPPPTALVDYQTLKCKLDQWANYGI